MIGLVAAQALPADMPAFMREAAAQLSYLNPEPDRWRDPIESHLDPALDAAQAPEHYVDLERVTAAMMQAPTRDVYLAEVHAEHEKAADVGLLPFAIVENVQRLRIEFRLWRAETDPTVRHYIEQAAIYDAGVLGHYVADGSNPHHTTVNYNGWVGDNPHHYTTDKSFHYRFEALYVQTHVKPADFAAQVAATKPRVYGDLRDAAWQYIEATHTYLEPLYRLEAEAPFNDQTQAPDHLKFTLDRLADGAQMLRDLWYTAWITSKVTPEQQEFLKQLQDKYKQPPAPAKPAG